MEAAGTTHAGRLRRRNEDAFAIDKELGLCMVADGLGGHAAGHIAAQTAIAEITTYMRAVASARTMQERDEAVPALTIGLLADAVKHANKAICAASRDVVPCSGMKTTIAAALFARGFAFLVHAGDSRIYRLRAGKLDLLTEDHSLAAEYLRTRGAKADLELARQGVTVLTRCLGKSPEVRVSARVDRCVPGDLYLLCTDGLWALLDDETIARTIVEAPDLQSGAERLINLANDAAGSDNITAVLARPQTTEHEEPQEPRA